MIQFDLNSVVPDVIVGILVISFLFTIYHFFTSGYHKKNGRKRTVTLARQQRELIEGGVK